MPKSTRDPKDSTIVTLAILTICYYLTENAILLLLALLISFLSLLSTTFRTGIHKMLTAATQIVGFLSQKVVLTLIFFGVLTPLALLYRIFGKREMKDFTRKTSSTFSERNETIRKTSFEKPW